MFASGMGSAAPQCLTEAVESLGLAESPLRAPLQAMLLWNTFGALFRALVSAQDITRADVDAVRQACWRALAAPEGQPQM